MTDGLREFEQLGRVLDRANYRLLVHNLTNGRVCQTPWVRAAPDRVAKLPNSTATLIRLMHTGEVVEESQVRGIFGSDITDGLTAAGLLQRAAGGVSLGPYAVLPFEGLYLVTQRWEPGQETGANHLWFGTDTCYVSRVLAAGCSRVLEVCTGVGTHALVMALRGAQVCGVDINPLAVRVARWNAHLNGLQGRARFELGDLYQPVAGEQFDYIVASPPFLPYPEDGKNDLLFATAGPSGLAVMDRILEGLGPRLAPKGRALFLAAGFGGKDGPYWASSLREMAVREGWRTELILLASGGASSELARLGRELPSVARELADLASGHDSRSERYWSFVVALEASTSPGELYVVDNSVSWRKALHELRDAPESATAI